MAAERAKFVLDDFDFSVKQVRQIRSHIENNSQIYETKSARRSIFAFMNRYDRHFGQAFEQWYDSRAASRKWMR